MYGIIVIYYGIFNENFSVLFFLNAGKNWNMPEFELDKF